MNKPLNFLAITFLCWFLAISLSLIIGILFLTESTRNEVPTVLLNLWVITLFALPVYAVCSFYPKKSIAIPVTAGLLLILSFTLNRGKFWHGSNTFSFPRIENLTFINSAGIREISSDDESSEEIDNELNPMPDNGFELPDEL